MPKRATACGKAGVPDGTLMFCARLQAHEGDHCDGPSSWTNYPSDGWWQLDYVPVAMVQVRLAGGVVAEAPDEFTHLVGYRMGKLWKRFGMRRIDGPGAPILLPPLPLTKRYA